jgi:hypothetical protein
MVMENEGFASTDWTSTRPHPFGPAPGGGMRGLAAPKWTSNSPRPFARAPGAGVGGFHDSGFAADRAADEVTLDPLLVLGKGPFTVKREPIGGGMVPSMLVQMYYTDRGTLTKERLDTQVRDLFKKAGYRTSRATSFASLPVSWRWHHVAQGDFYYPVISAPANIAGMRYSGSALSLPVYEASADDLARLPRTINVYTIAVTSGHQTMSDGDAAQTLTLLKQAMVNMASAGGYAHVVATIKGAPQDVFERPEKPLLASPAAKVGLSSMLLVIAYNMLVQGSAAG